jgi:hypothetical protein
MRIQRAIESLTILGFSWTFQLRLYRSKLKDILSDDNNPTQRLATNVLMDRGTIMHREVKYICTLLPFPSQDMSGISSFALEFISKEEDTDMVKNNTMLLYDCIDSSFCKDALFNKVAPIWNERFKDKGGARFFLALPADSEQVANNESARMIVLSKTTGEHMIINFDVTHPENMVTYFTPQTVEKLEPVAQ